MTEVVAAGSGAVRGSGAGPVGLPNWHNGTVCGLVAWRRLIMVAAGSSLPVKRGSLSAMCVVPRTSPCSRHAKSASKGAQYILYRAGHYDSIAEATSDCDVSGACGWVCLGV